ncbi:hypothetical protein JXA88_08475 [Candidatus Fermentibacteria bacterium]|nr:hypothetical protein [Candidatus Fermentibacteria bacterium]
MTTDRTHARVWWAAFFLAVLFHGLVVLLVNLGRPFAPREAMAAPPQPIELVFAASAEEPPARSEPSFFSELPPDRADEPPQRPDFLSTVDSRARDLVPDGDEAMPLLAGLSEAPHIRIDPGTDGLTGADVPAEQWQEPAPLDRPQESRQPAQEPDPASLQVLHEEDTVLSPDRADAPGGASREAPSLEPPSSLDPRASAFQPQVPPRGLARRPGTDFYQVEMHRPEGNAALPGSISLNTVAWAYAPWLSEFSRRLQRSWLAPVAYYMGIIDGVTEIEMEVARDGALMRLVVLNAKGHDSLRETSVSVLEAIAPYRPLPDDFPEKSLILRITLVYPSLRSRGR